MNLSHFRRSANLTQKKFAAKLGVDQSTVSKWERNSSSPNIETLKKIAKVLNCTVDDLLA